MKKKLFPIVLVLSFLSGVFSQGVWEQKKVPSEIRGCINISSRLNSILNAGEIKNGRILIWHIENEVDLYADVREIRNGNKTERRIVRWRLLDGNRNEVSGIEGSRKRRNKEQTLVYTERTDPEGCFVVKEQ